MLLEPSQKGESFQPTKTIEEWIDLALLLAQNAIAHLFNSGKDESDGGKMVCEH